VPLFSIIILDMFLKKEMFKAAEFKPRISQLWV